MKKLLILVTLVAFGLAASAQGYSTTLRYDGHLVTPDLTDAYYTTPVYWDTTGAFVIPKGALRVTIYNTTSSVGTIQGQNVKGNGPALEFSGFESHTIRRAPYVLLDSIVCDATGTRFSVIQHR